MTANPAPQLGDSEKFIVYQVLAARRTAYDSMMWQTPALGMTAQAFLLTLSLGSGTSSVSRIITAFVSIVISLMVLQLLAKHRRNELSDCLALERLENELHINGVVGVDPHGKPANRMRLQDVAAVDRQVQQVLMGPKSFWNMSSFNLWCIGQYCFILVGVAIIVLTVSAPSLLNLS